MLKDTGEVKPVAYYNEIDPQKAAWLRELIKAGHIAPGVVDERSIEDVTPNDLAGFTQCHFFAGIAVWSYALRLAGWPDGRPVWTGSCPCQPFSAAGKGEGFADERHLWPAFFHLISQCRPVTVFGEQVGSKGGLAWLDLVFTDMEATDYACGAANIPAAGFGAPHIRQRLYWVAHALQHGRESQPQEFGGCSKVDGANQSGNPRNGILRLADTTLRRQSGGVRQCGSPEWPAREAGRYSSACGLDNPISNRRREGRNHYGEHDRQQPCATGDIERPGPVNGFWRDADWLHCRDERWRPVRPGTFPLAHGAPARVVRLRGYGDAINAEAAKEFIMAFLAHEQHMRAGEGVK